MELSLYVQLSVMMFLQFAVWGAWSPVLAARLLGPLKMTGKQTGWIYGTIYIGCIISPLIAGQIADRWIATQHFLAAAHLAGGALLLLAARQRRYVPLLAVMLLYALAFAPTLGLVNSLMFTHIKGFENQALTVLIWGTVGWAAAGLGLTLGRKLRGSGEGADCLILAGLLSLVLGAYCLTLPHTPPPGADQALAKAMTMLSDSSFVVYLAVAFVLGTQLQFFFLGTAPYLAELGISARSTPAVMALAQAAQLAATLLLAWKLPDLLPMTGYRGLFTVGIAMWLAMYLIYSTRSRGGVVAAQALHGAAYTFFIWLGFLYVNAITPAGIPGSGQAIYVMVLFGLGFFAGTIFTGAVMDRLRTADGRFRWREIYLVPCAASIVCLLVLALFFRG